MDVAHTRACWSRIATPEKSDMDLVHASHLSGMLRIGFRECSPLSHFVPTPNLLIGTRACKHAFSMAHQQIGCAPPPHTIAVNARVHCCRLWDFWHGGLQKQSAEARDSV